MLVVALCACRFDFDGYQKSIDAPTCGATPGAAQSQPLTCNQPMRFEVNATCVDQFAAAETASGISVFTVDWQNNLAGWAFDPVTGAAITQNAHIESLVSHVVGAVDTVDGPVVVSAVNGNTTVYPVDAASRLRGPASTVTGVPSAAPLASGTGAVALGTFASNAFSLHSLSTLGVETLPPKVIVDSSLSPSFGSVIATTAGYLTTWRTAMTMPNSVVVEQLDAGFAAMAGPVTASLDTAGTHDAINPHIAWAPTSSRSLAVWFQKTDTGDDDIWMMMFDGALAPIGPATQLATSAASPVVASDGTDFWVAYQSHGKLVAARVPASGAPSTNMVPDSGGSPQRHTIVSGNGHATIVWIEHGATGPDLWIQQLCH